MVAQLKHTPNLTDLWRFELGGRQETKGKNFLIFNSFVSISETKVNSTV